MRGRASKARTTPFAKWLQNEIDTRGMTVRLLAEKSGITHPRISQVLNGDDPTRAFVKGMVHGLLSDDPDVSEYKRLLTSGLRMAFLPEEELQREAILDNIRERGYLQDIPPDAWDEIMEYLELRRQQEKRKKDAGISPNEKN